jgi:hypothetical protein
MKPLFHFAVLALLAVAPLRAAEPNTLTGPERDAGWKLLFDGTSMAGWRGYAQEKPGAGWRVEDGTLVTSGKKEDLLTAEQFGDFDLRFDWKISVGGNSGVIYRVGLGESATYRTGPEYQVLDNLKAEDNKKPNHLAGSLYDIGAPPPKDYTNPVGEWNEGRIRVRGWHVEHWLNGHMVVDLDLATPEGRAAIAASKFKDWPKFASLARGYLALQDHGNVVSYRNIKVRELK